MIIDTLYLPLKSIWEIKYEILVVTFIMTLTCFWFDNKFGFLSRFGVKNE